MSAAGDTAVQIEMEIIAGGPGCHDRKLAGWVKIQIIIFTECRWKAMHGEEERKKWKNVFTPASYAGAQCLAARTPPEKKVNDVATYLQNIKSWIDSKPSPISRYWDVECVSIHRICQTTPSVGVTFKYSNILIFSLGTQRNHQGLNGLSLQLITTMEIKFN